MFLVVSFVGCKTSNVTTISSEKQESSKGDSLAKIKDLENTIKEKDEEISKLKTEKDKELDRLRSEKDSEINILMSEMDKRTITFEDQKQVEKLIKDYFAAIERKDYASAWELTSPEQKKDYTKEVALNEHWGIESLKFISIEGYLPVRISNTMEMLPNTPTVWFKATFQIESSPNTAWGPKGKTARYIDVIKGTDGRWSINGLATGI
jgi:hypothetical protein